MGHTIAMCLSHPTGVVRWCVGLLSALGLWTAALATTVVPPEFELLVNESDYVVRAVVEAKRSEYRHGPQGRIIVTLVKLRVVDRIVGQVPDEVELEMVGGEIGQERLVLNGAPVLNVGDEDFLFVRDNGRTVYPLFAMMHGRYPVRRDAATGREYVVRSNDVPMQDVAEVALPLATGPVAGLQARLSSPATALSPADFTARIKQVFQANYVRARH